MPTYLCDNCDREFSCGDNPETHPGKFFCRECMTDVGVNMLVGVPYPAQRVFVYIRVSSRGQDAPQFGRAGLTTQLQAVMNFASQFTLRVCGTYEDVGSGRFIEKLVQLKKLVRCLKEGDCVLIYSVSRIGRNVADVMKVIDKIHSKGAYVFATSVRCHSRDTQFQVFAQQAMEESQNLSKVMRESYQRRIANGHAIGPAPFGKEAYHDDNGIRRFRDNENELFVVKQIIDLYNKLRDFNKVACEMYDNGSTNRDRHWTAKSIERVVETFKGKSPKVSRVYQIRQFDNGEFDIPPEVLEKFKSMKF